MRIRSIVGIATTATAIGMVIGGTIGTLAENHRVDKSLAETTAPYKSDIESQLRGPEARELEAVIEKPNSWFRPRDFKRYFIWQEIANALRNNCENTPAQQIIKEVLATLKVNF